MCISKILACIFVLTSFYRIAGNFHKNPVFPPEEIFVILIFALSAGYWPRPFIITRLTEDERWERVGPCLRFELCNRHTSDRARLAYKTHGVKIFQKFMCSNFRSFIFHGSYFRILVVGCENHKIWTSWKFPAIQYHLVLESHILR